MKKRNKIEYDRIRLDMPYTEKDMEVGERKVVRKKELQYERYCSFIGVVKYIVFTPLIKLFELLNGLMKVFAGASVFCFFLRSVSDVQIFFGKRRG